MTVAQARQCLYEIVRDYYGNDHVFWAGAKLTRKPVPFVTIQFTGYTRQMFPPHTMSDDEFWTAHRLISASVDINLYTKGQNVSEGHYDAAYGNTALEDLENLASYLDSEYVTGKAQEFRDVDGNKDPYGGMAILVDPEIKDLSALLKDSQYEYRAVCSLTLLFTDASSGDYGQNENPALPDSSGGGNEAMITDPSVTEEAEINGGYT